MTGPMDDATADVMRDVLAFLDASADEDSPAQRVILRNTQLLEFVESMADLVRMLVAVRSGLTGDSPAEEIAACMHEFTARRRTMLTEAGEHD